ncbi:hypothetical protein CDL12_00182 [Handroanthus impetiginosus]|uniref:Uncharacterized protein n=1 Tax=Handroanthus impetiginosus TaxID=429701 RepID=A0A2G9IBJ9_9LAMI|nr:hypothetical protein CDL12_00182 [Handroanthus impetiginosus]
MHRVSSYSTARSSDEFLVNFSQSALKGYDSNEELLTSYNESNNLISDDVSKKDVSPKGSPGERAVHLIPLVLVICGLVLWWFSNPVELQ